MACKGGAAAPYLSKERLWELTPQCSVQKNERVFRYSGFGIVSQSHIIHLCLVRAGGAKTSTEGTRSGSAKRSSP